jgi:phosphatidylglycerol:prolipoprotein diacylglycerol transferase
LLKSFGFLVAMGFLAAGYVISLELKRKEAKGLIGFTIQEITTGKGASMSDYIVNGLIGFAIGYKMLGMFLDWQVPPHRIL